MLWNGFRFTTEMAETAANRARIKIVMVRFMKTKPLFPGPWDLGLQAGHSHHGPETREVRAWGEETAADLDLEPCE